ncbi:MAG: sugar kinase [Propionibacteriaceae bacterium]|jgi:sugar (pentulose or hexulose) kinase|nr:sugar kinase [Propionibacteriaceae bacterium]
MSKYLIGIDNGSQSSKVVIFDLEGRVAALGRQALRPNDTPRPGVVEHPGDDLWDSICAASKRALAAFRGDPAEIVGAGLCTIRFCRAMVRADGRLAQPVLSWMDARVGRPYLDDDPQAALATTSSGYITGRITGRGVDSAANHAGMWPLDPQTWDWLPDGPEFSACGYPREKLVELVLPGELLGNVTAEAAAASGLPVGLPVYATANDKAVEALGSGLRGENDLLLSLGTYIAAMSVGRRHVPAASAFWTNYACEPHRYLYESNGIRRGMWTVSFVRDLFGREVTLAAEEAGLSPEEYLNRAAAQVPAGSEGLLALLDWLAPTDAPQRKGAFVGFDGRQGRAHLYRAVLEAIAMGMAGKARAMAEELGADYRRLIVSGGGSSSDLMMQIAADCFGVESVRMEVNNAASLGSAICAGVGSGAFASFDDAVQAMVRPAATFTPDAANQRLYQRLAPIHEGLQAALDETNQRLYEVVG